MYKKKIDAIYLMHFVSIKLPGICHPFSSESHRNLIGISSESHRMNSLKKA